jgi:hypothetical protein
MEDLMAKSAKKPEKKQFECAVHGKKAPTDEVGAKGASSREADAERAGNAHARLSAGSVFLISCADDMARAESIFIE